MTVAGMGLVLCVAAALEIEEEEKKKEKKERRRSEKTSASKKNKKLKDWLNWATTGLCYTNWRKKILPASKITSEWTQIHLMH